MGCAGPRGIPSVPATLGCKQLQSNRRGSSKGWTQKPVTRSPAGQSGRCWGEGNRSHHLLSVPNFFHPQAACRLFLPSPACELLGSTLGVPTPPQEPGLEPTLTMRPLGTPRCLGFPGMPLLFTGPRHGGYPPWGLWAAPQARACRAAGRRRREPSSAPVGPHILKDQLTTSFLCHRKCLYRNGTTEKSKV